MLKISMCRLSWSRPYISSIYLFIYLFHDSWHNGQYVSRDVRYVSCVCCVRCVACVRWKPRLATSAQVVWYNLQYDSPLSSTYLGWVSGRYAAARLWTVESTIQHALFNVLPRHQCCHLGVILRRQTHLLLHRERRAHLQTVSSVEICCKTSRYATWLATASAKVVIYLSFHAIACHLVSVHSKFSHKKYIVPFLVMVFVKPKHSSPPSDVMAAIS